MNLSTNQWTNECMTEWINVGALVNKDDLMKLVDVMQDFPKVSSIGDRTGCAAGSVRACVCVYIGGEGMERQKSRKEGGGGRTPLPPPSLFIPSNNIYFPTRFSFFTSIISFSLSTVTLFSHTIPDYSPSSDNIIVSLHYFIYLNLSIRSS